ncbi:MAG TPA: LarC family nickel insertion protein [Actinomycetota bacterium]|nr:LarC family nickel insertion protein [Actinomycetota bacterium]
MRLAYFDCFSGISGDMALAALVHAGADLEEIGKVLSTLPIEDFQLASEEVDVRGMPALTIHVQAGPQGVIRTWSSMPAVLDEIDLPPEARRSAYRMFHRLAHAAGTVHGKDPELVTFHEFGEVDCLVAFVGCALGLEMLGVDRVFASPVPTGMGMVRTEHGIMPIPSPVVMELLHGVPTYSRGIPIEMVTPTGAAILSAVSEGYGDMPMMRADHVGYGAGPYRPDFPNVLRVVIGEEQRAGTGARPAVTLADFLAQGQVMIQTVLDGSSTEQTERLIEELAGAGTDEAWITSVVGPGGRPRLLISAVAPSDRRGQVIRCLRESGAPGEIRVSPVFPAPTAD